MDTLEMLGKLVPEDVGRDAVHIAVIPQVATTFLAPGESVKVRGKKVGIVDPYLDGPVKKGERYWLFLMPMSIKSLRHVWTHELFADETTNESASLSAVELKRTKAREWLEYFANRLGPFDADDVINAARWSIGQDSICMGDDLNEYLDADDELWANYQEATGESVPRSKRPKHFRCAC